jgi:chromosome partitioning protein
MGHIVCITSQKGGVGKTTTAINLATAFAMAEKGSLLVDCDPLGHATTGLGFDKARIKKSLYDGLVGQATAEELIIRSEPGCLKLLPSKIELCRVEAKLMPDKDKKYLLRDLLIELKDEYDYIVIDSPPSLNILTINAINASDLLLIPLQCEFYALEGLCYQLKIIKALRESLNPDIRIAGILLTMFDEDEKISSQIVKDVRVHFKDMVFKTVIPRNTILRNSPCYGETPVFHNIMSVGAQSYLELAKEFMGRWPIN